MLYVYNDWKFVSDNIEKVLDNRAFFLDTTVNKLDNRLNGLTCRTDGAIYYNSNIFIDKFGIPVPWRGLSTGGMTTLNIFYNQDKCFNLVECGPNALRDILLIRNGYIAEIMGLNWNDNLECEICFNNDETYIYRNIRDFMGDEEDD